MPRVTVFNNHPTGERITEEAIQNWIGKEVPIKFEGRWLGLVKIVEASSNDAGVTITYETNGHVGLSLALPTENKGENIILGYN